MSTAATSRMRALIAVAGLLSLPLPAAARAEPFDIGGLTIHRISAAPARKGETAVLTLTVENGSSQRIVVTGLRAGAHGKAKLLADIGNDRHARIGSIGIDPPGSDLAHGPIGLRFETAPLRRDLPSGEVIEAELFTTAAPLPIAISVGDDGLAHGGQAEPAATGSLGQS